MTIQDVVNKVREFAANYPDNKYERESLQEPCKYLDGSCSNGSCGCIFGQVFLELGAPRDVLEKADCSIWSAVTDVLDDLDIEYNQEQGRWCGYVQTEQDEGHTWSESVQLADQYVREPRILGSI